MTYTYDGEGNRVKKSSGRLYWYGAMGIMAESNSTGTLTAEYAFFDGMRIARRDYSSGTVHYYFSDHLKSTSVVTTSAGVIEEESDYRPWGEEMTITHTLADQHYKFNGKERDTETGFDGNTVTIENAKQASYKVGDDTIRVDKTVKFNVEAGKGTAALTGISGLSAKKGFVWPGINEVRYTSTGQNRGTLEVKSWITKRLTCTSDGCK